MVGAHWPRQLRHSFRRGGQSLESRQRALSGRAWFRRPDTTLKALNSSESGVFSRRLGFPQADALADPAREKQEGPVFFSERAGHSGKKRQGEEALPNAGKCLHSPRPQASWDILVPPPPAPTHCCKSCIPPSRLQIIKAQCLLTIGSELVQRNAALAWTFPPNETHKLLTFPLAPLAHSWRAW